MCTQRVCSWCVCSERLCADGESPASSQVSPGSPGYLSQTQHRVLALCLPQAGTCCPAMPCEDVSSRGTTAPSAADGVARVHPHKAPCCPLSGGVWAFHLQPPSAAPIHPSPRAHRPQRPLFQWNVLAACLKRAFLIGFACQL